MAAELARRLELGGSTCDHCGKTAEAAGVARLSACKRCLMAYYCSTDCQRARWKAGHKQACRAPNKVQVGDHVKLTNLASRPELNDKVVRVLAAVPDREGRWEVAVDGGVQRTLSVAAEKLERLRPQHSELCGAERRE